MRVDYSRPPVHYKSLFLLPVTPAGSPRQGHTCPSWVPKPSGRVVRWPSEDNGGEPGCDTDWSHRATVSQLCTDRAAHSRRHWCAFRAEPSVLEALSCCGGESPSCPLGVPQRYKHPGESRANTCNWVEVFRLFKRKEGIKGKTLTTPLPLLRFQKNLE